MRVRRCDKCGSMAETARTRKTMVIHCKGCGYRVTKKLVRKGRGG